MAGVSLIFLFLLVQIFWKIVKCFPYCSCQWPQLPSKMYSKCRSPSPCTELQHQRSVYSWGSPLVGWEAKVWAKSCHRKSPEFKVMPAVWLLWACFFTLNVSRNHAFLRMERDMNQGALLSHPHSSWCYLKGPPKLLMTPSPPPGPQLENCSIDTQLL